MGELVWFKFGKKPLYVWRPIPPSRKFVCVGMFCTTNLKNPKLKAMRCVPKSWLIHTTQQPTCIWKDLSEGDKSMWIMNKMGLLIASKGVGKPDGVFYDFPKRKFMAYQNKSDR